MVTMSSRPTDVASLVNAITSGEARLGSTRLVAIDGPAGSGKTTLAERLRSQLVGLGVDVALLHMDDLYDGWAGLDEALAGRVLAQVVRPLSSGTSARWHRYDWDEGRFGRWETLPPPAVLILEGCGSGARAYASSTTLLVWVEAAKDTRIARGVERDGRQVIDHWLAWMNLEAEHFAVNDTRRRADLRLITD